MESLKIINFKAHQNLDEIKFDEKNFLLYGDNGAGKSSLYEALKLCFFRDKIEKDIPEAHTPENIAQNKQDFYNEFKNTIVNEDFEIKINNVNFDSFQTSNYGIYMLNLDTVVFDKTLKLSTLFEKVFFNLPEDIQEKYEDIQAKANSFLESCLEDIKIEIDASDDYSIKLENTQRNITKTKELTKYFNEARLNLVIFALLFSAIEVSKDESKKNVLILDDFITSLDMANRTFLMKHILETFKDFQIVVFTHNVYFYNLIMYLVNDKICTTDKEWQFANLYEIDNEHKIYLNNNLQDVDTIEKDHKEEVESNNFINIGNKLRQKFERLVYELSKIISVGGVEESNRIIEAIANQNMLLNHQGKSCCDLIKDIETLIAQDNNQGYISNKINNQINKYKIASFEELQDVLNTLKLYRKVSMHSLSHGQIGQHNWSDKEVKQTLLLLKKLETNIKSLTSSTVN